MSELRIAVTCDACGSKFKVKAIAAGKTVKCGSCGDPIAVPLAEPGSSEEFNIAEMLGESEPIRQPTILTKNPTIEPSGPVSSVEQARAQITKERRTPSDDGDYRDFTALKFLAWICKILAWAVAGIFLLQMCGMTVVAVLSKEGPTLTTAIFAQLALIVPTGFLILTLYVYAEIILLALQVERNTYKSARNSEANNRVG